MKTKTFLKSNAFFWIITAFIIISAVIYCAVYNAKFSSAGLYVYFVDVGQGDCELLKAGNSAVLIDTGTSESADILTEFINNHTERIDYLILTHSHNDHTGGTLKLLERTEVTNVIINEDFRYSEESKAILKAVKEKGITLTEASFGFEIIIGELKLTFVSPRIDSQYLTENDKSLVVRADYGENSFLFAADSEKNAERIMLDRGVDVDCDVLKVGHHGSSGSSLEAFIKAVSPEYAVISCAYDNEYGHPEYETLSVLEKYCPNILRTDCSGTVLLYSDGKNVTYNDVQ